MIDDHEIECERYQTEQVGRLLAKLAGQCRDHGVTADAICAAMFAEGVRQAASHDPSAIAIWLRCFAENLERCSLNSCQGNA